MKIILLEQVVNLGKLGEVVEVKNGYARNFLIPQGKAKRANEVNLKEFADRKAEYESRQAEIFADAQDRHERLDGVTFTVQAKSGVDGKLFGSVTSGDIVKAIQESGVAIKRTEISLPHGPIKTTGDFEVLATLHHDIKSNIKVNVVPLSQ